VNKNGLSNKVKSIANEFGYDLCGIIKAEPFKEFVSFLDERIEHFPNSSHLYKKLYGLAFSNEKEVEAKSIIVCIRRYNKYKIPEGMDKYIGKTYLFDGRLDYSEEYKNSVLFENQMKEFGFDIKKYDLAARWAAAKAGLGRFGKNNFIYTEFGSWVWIDTWIVNQEMEYDEPSKLNNICPANCTKCIDACPTKALSGPKMMDRGACIAQLSFYSATNPSEVKRDEMGTLLYGCDICQDVCPMNKNKWKEEQDFPRLNDLLDYLSLEKILEMDEETFLNIIQPRFWYIGKDNIWLWKSNAIRAMVNSNEIKYHEFIKKACQNENEKVQEMAVWACEKLGLYI
jgi:epoxyqueuosine reductase